MIYLKKGSRGPAVKKLQLKLREKGFWTHTIISKYFGKLTKEAVRKFQKASGLLADGIVGDKTLNKLGFSPEDMLNKTPEHKYKNVTIKGSTFPDSSIKTTLKVKLSKEIREEYLPTLDEFFPEMPFGLKLLATVMTHKEGFYKGTRSYRTNNPGNIGNTDSGKNKFKNALAEGISMQINYILKVTSGEHSAYPLNKRKIIRPYYSKEIARNSKVYGIDPYLPGYDFIYTGTLEQFVKIYSTGARAGNGYLSLILSYFKQNGITLTPQSKLEDIISTQKP